MKLPKFLRRKSPSWDIQKDLVGRGMIPIFVPRKDSGRIQAILADAGIKTSPIVGLARVDQLEQTYGGTAHSVLPACGKFVFTCNGSQKAAWLIDQEGHQIVINDPLGDVADYIAADQQLGRVPD
jgi:hypothetical protein